MSNTYWVSWEMETFRRGKATDPWDFKGVDKGSNALIVGPTESALDVLGRRGVSSMNDALHKRVVHVTGQSRLP